jgi:hypothetical protein
MERLVKGDTKVIKVKTGSTAKTTYRSILEVGKISTGTGSKEGTIFTEYPFLKAQKTEVLTMIQVIEGENSTNPKELIRKLAQESKKSLKTMNEEMGTDEQPKAKKAPTIRQKRTLKLTEEKVEISTEVIKKSAEPRAKSARKSAVSSKTTKARTTRTSAVKLSATSAKQKRASSKSAAPKKAAEPKSPQKKTPAAAVKKEATSKPRTPVKPQVGQAAV